MSNSSDQFVGTGFKLGKGTYKTVYSCVTTDANNAIFILPKDANVDKLCIAVVDIANLARKTFGNHEQYFNQYMEQSAEKKRGNKYRDAFEQQLKDETDKIIGEINLQKEFFEKQLAPQIYEHKIDESSRTIYILQEKCGISLITPTEKKNETNILKKIKITKIFGDVNAPFRALYYLTITTFYGCNG
jgi:hypothetical protein